MIRENFFYFRSALINHAKTSMFSAITFKNVCLLRKIPNTGNHWLEPVPQSFLCKISNTQNIVAWD